MAHFIANGEPTSLVQVHVGGQTQIQLWGEGPNGSRLDVSPSDLGLILVEEIAASFRPNVRSFSLRGLRQGSGRVYGRVSPGGQIWADMRVVVGSEGLSRFYHGTSSAIANLLTSVDLTPMFLSTALVTRFDWTDYTDFGKGFYVHLETNKAMAYEWAKRRFLADWAVVEFIATGSELQDLSPTALRFQNKLDRPVNAPQPVTVTTSVRSLEWCLVPQLLLCLQVSEETTTRTRNGPAMSWLEFVEHNRHVQRSQMLIARPNDRDWTSSYSSIRGPIWVPRDSGYSVGLPVFPDNLHQLNWGLAGMAMLNTAECKVRRFKFSTENEGLFP